MEIQIFYVSWRNCRRIFCKLFLLLLVGASHYYHSQYPSRHNSSIPEAPDLQALSRLTSSSQSLHAILPLTLPEISNSNPQLDRNPLKAPSVADIASVLNKSPATYNSLCQLTNLCSYGNASILKSNAVNHRVRRSSEENTESTTLAFEIPLLNTAGKHMPMEIRVCCVFLRVGEIDTLNERYTAEIFFEASWFIKDPRNGSTGKYDPQAGHFNPQLVVLNHMGDSLRHDVCIDKQDEQIFFVDFASFRNGIPSIKLMTTI